MSSIWADKPDLTPKLQELWNLGRSATECAAELGHGLTRNAVVTKVYRLREAGMEFYEHANYGHNSRKKGTANLKVVAIKKIAALPEIVTPSEPLRLDGALVTLETLHPSRMCKYPFGSPGADNFHFCANTPKDGSVYCTTHHDKCYQPITGQSNLNRSMLSKSGILRALG